MASIMYRYSDYKGYDVTDTASLSNYTDGNQVSEYAKDVMKWAVGSGLLSGRGDNLLAPQGQTTRAEAATILMRYCEENDIDFSTNVPNEIPDDGESSEEVPDGNEASDNNSSITPHPDDPSSGSDSGDEDGEFDSFEEAYEDFMDQEVSDFSEDRVLKFDENDTKDNFAVVNDDVVIVRDNDSVNQLSTQQENDSRIYTITNAESPITMLNNGDKLLMLGNTPEESVAICVEKIEINETTVTIHAANATLSDFFKYIQVDKEMMVDKSCLDTSEMSEGLTYKGTFNNKVLGTLFSRSSQTDEQTGSIVLEESSNEEDDNSLNIDQSIEALHGFSVGYRGETAEINGDVTAQISVDIVINYGPEWFGEDYIRCDLTSSMRIDDVRSLQVVADDEIPFVLGEIIVPIGATGFLVEGKIFINIKYNGTVKGTVSSILQTKYGFTFNSDDDIQN